MMVELNQIQYNLCNTFKTRFSPLWFMQRRSLAALFLTGLMVLSGCFGAVSQNDDESEIDEPLSNTVELTAAWGVIPDSIPLDGTPVLLTIVVQNKGDDWDAQPTILTPQITVLTTFELEKTPQGLQLMFIPQVAGDYSILVHFTVINNAEFTSPRQQDLVHTITIIAPEEEAPILWAPVMLSLEEPSVIWFEGNVVHSALSTCSLMIHYGEEMSKTGIVKDDGTWKTLLDLSEVTDSFEIRTVVECGNDSLKSDTVTTQVLVEHSGDDADGDGILDLDDRCPNGYGASDGWSSTNASDQDNDGCHDFEEDFDDDNDGILDHLDLCPTSFGWISTPDADYDSDGCHDTDYDDDDDNDGVLDSDDFCPRGLLNWASGSFSDWDGDGCSDLDEDDDDDNDNLLDNADTCPKGVVDWVRDGISDYDDDGCNDVLEDIDDDNDGVYDVNATGHLLDECPKTPLNTTEVNEVGCAAVERDTDADGVNDLFDQCPGTPTGLVVNTMGCADLDDDGVFANVDICPDSPEKWTIDSQGCAVVQSPVSWTSGSTLTGPMQIVPHFSVPTLDGTFLFQQEWTGYDIYYFLFKYTDSSGNSNSATWGQSPGPFIRGLPSNVHLFFGSFDSTYHSDVVNRKAAVESALNPNEETAWEGRIHYIDQRANSITGGLGQMISNFNSPMFMGIDRFQMARETGSLYAWTSSNYDPQHLIHEPHQWNAEFPVEIRRHDTGVEEVTVLDFYRHTGGWSGGFTTTTNAVFPSNLTDYDTLEVYHEHACDERSNRYQKSDGSNGGCHEWDYEANLRICDRDNASACGTEYMRWITTYGREGKWLTDISPYLFMLENEDNRTFKYRGANKGDLTITFLLSNWGSGLRGQSADFAFTGGQFDGTYNDLTKYTRDLNFTVPSWADKVEIVATITGHGFGKDNANCAEFCDHQHHYYLNGLTTYEWHPIVHVSSGEGCELEVRNGVVANQYGSWPYGRAGWCAGQDVKQWTYDITSWSDMTGGVNHLTYRGLYNGQEYTPSDGVGNGQRNIHAEIWVVYYNATT